MGAGMGLLALQRGGVSVRTMNSVPRDGREWTNMKTAKPGVNTPGRALRYTAANSYGGYGGYGRWSSWSRDYPKADRQFLIALRRASTRIQARPTEQVVDLESDEIFNYPWVLRRPSADLTFTEPEAKRLRGIPAQGRLYIGRRFHGASDWERFMSGMLMVFSGPPPSKT